ncbi:MAG: DUF6599 family protein [Acidobacteriota bacterium]
MKTSSLVRCPGILPLLFMMSFWPARGLSQSSAGFRFPELSGWKAGGEVKTFHPGNLFEYIDGAAELYLSYDFVQLQVAEYQGEKGASIVVEVYRHRTPDDAFGIYSQERPSDGRFVDVGAEGYVEPPILNFVLGDAYVKISGYEIGGNERDVLMAFAKATATALGGGGSLPAPLAWFPAEGKVAHTERYVAKNFVGYEFLHRGFTADYAAGGKEFQLFIIQGNDANDCDEMLRAYARFLGEKTDMLAAAELTLADPYHGQIGILRKGNCICGVLKVEDKSSRERYLKALAARIATAD